MLAIDWLVHHAVILEMTGKSRRAQEAKSHAEATLNPEPKQVKS